MPTLPSNRAERFARQLATGEKTVQAYIRAGYSPKGADANASKLRNKPAIKARVAELIAARLREGLPTMQEDPHGKPLEGEWDWEGEVPISFLRRRLKEVHDRAMGAEKFADALAALKALGQTVGVFPDQNKGIVKRPAKEPGPPRFRDAPEEGSHRDTQSKPAVAVQIINRISREVGGRGSDESEDAASPVLDLVATTVRALPDQRSVPMDGCLGGNEGEAGTGVPVEVGGSGA